MRRTVYPSQQQPLVMSNVEPTKLPDVHHVVLVLEHSGFVVIYVQIVWSTEDRHDAGKPSRPCLSIHAIPSILSLMGTDYRQEVILLEECASGVI